MPRHQNTPKIHSTLPLSLHPPIAQKTILNADEVRRATARIAHEILERTRGGYETVLVGLYTEGIPLAQRLAHFMSVFEGVTITVGTLDFSQHRDDRKARGPFPTQGPTVLPADLSGKTVILVDDVICTGRSMRAALDALLSHSRPDRVQCAVLIDRGHRELPIRADYIGKNVPTGQNEWIEVRLTELNGEDLVVLIRKDDEPRSIEQSEPVEREDLS